MKRKLFALLALVMVLSLAACGGGGKDAAQYSTDAKPTGPASAESAGGAWDAPMDAQSPDMAQEENGAGAIYNGAPENAKIIYTADMELETKDYDSACQQLTKAVADAGGYFESRSINQGGSYRRLNCVVRVPVENFLSFLDTAGEAAHVTSRTEYSEDVSEVYYDSEARLATQRTKLERLQELLRQAEAMEDIIAIESAISETELQIEYLTGSLRKYDSQINYSTVNLSLYEVYRLSNDEETPLTFGDRFGSALGQGFYRGVEGLEDFAISIARNWVTLLVWAAVILAAVLLLRKRSLRKKAARIAEALPQVKPGDVKKSGDESGGDQKE